MKFYKTVSNIEMWKNEMNEKRSVMVVDKGEKEF